MVSLQEVHEGVRPAFEYQVQFIEKYIYGIGLDMGCGSCPLLWEDCTFIDVSPQPVCIEQVGFGRFIQTDAVAYRHHELVDFIFSSHMVEDLGSEDEIIDCLIGWGDMIRPGGSLILMLPDMQGGRYATVEEGGNVSHQVNVGKEFLKRINKRMPMYKMIQLDTVPHDKSCSIDAVFRRLP
jgi:hypothetical protein